MAMTILIQESDVRDIIKLLSELDDYTEELRIRQQEIFSSATRSGADVGANNQDNKEVRSHVGDDDPRTKRSERRQRQ